jgi:uncharacterized protein (TIGR02001 family)
MKTLVCLLLAATGMAAASDGKTPDGNSVTLTATLATEYAWRGISLSQRKPALQLGLDLARPLTHDLSLEAGAWAYSTRYADFPQVRLDTGAYARLGGPTPWHGLRWGLQGARYVFPQARAWNYNEVTASLGRAADEAVGSIGFDLALSQSDNAFGTRSRGRYLEAEATMRLPRAIDLKLHLGRSVYERPALTYPSFTDARVALATSAAGLDLELAWLATRGGHFGRMGRGRMVAAVSRSF